MGHDLIAVKQKHIPIKKCSFQIRKPTNKEVMKFGVVCWFTGLIIPCLGYPGTGFILMFAAILIWGCDEHQGSGF